jgi:hypothetical protein
MICISIIKYLQNDDDDDDDIRNQNNVSCWESVLEGDIILIENVQKSVYVICSNDALDWRIVF